MIQESRRRELQLQFVATLDTVLRRKSHDTEFVLKLGALTAKHMVMSDTQFLDNEGMRQLLLHDGGFREFLTTADVDGVVPIVCCARSPKLEKILTDMVVERDRPMLLSSFSGETNQRLQALSSTERNIERFLNIAGPEYRDYVGRLNGMFFFEERAKSLSLLPWAEWRWEYSDLVREALEAKIQALNDAAGLIGTSRQAEDTLRMCVHLQRSIENRRVDRSALYRELRKIPGKQASRQGITREIIDRPYIDNMVLSNGFHRIGGREHTRPYFEAMAPLSANPVRRLKPISEVPIAALPLRIEQIGWEHISVVRSSNSFQELIRKLCEPGANPDSRAHTLRDYFSFLHGELSRIPTGHHKLRGHMKARLKIFRVSDSEREALLKERFTLSDACGCLGKGGSFVIGKLVGLFSGIPFVGEATTTVIENLFDYMGPSRARSREFKHLLATLAAGKEETAEDKA
jgi:hypothetical protein